MEYIEYAGYEVSDSNLKEKLLPLLGEKTEHLRQSIFTVRHHCSDTPQDQIISWYRRNTGVVITGYLRKIFVHESKRGFTIVGEITIESGIFYLTLANDNQGITLQNVKRLANNGSLGIPTVLDEKIPLELKKCMKRK